MDKQKNRQTEKCPTDKVLAYNWPNDQSPTFSVFLFLKSRQNVKDPQSFSIQ